MDLSRNISANNSIAGLHSGRHNRRIAKRYITRANEEGVRIGTSKNSNQLVRSTDTQVGFYARESDVTVTAKWTEQRRDYRAGHRILHELERGCGAG